MATFRFPNSLRAHMRFKCEHRRSLHPMDSIQASVALATREMKEKLLASGFMDYRAHLYATGFHPRLPVTGTGKAGTESVHSGSGGTLPSPASSSGSTCLSSPGKLSPGPERKRSRSRSPAPSSGTRSPVEEKRKRSALSTPEEDFTSAKRLATEESRKPETFSPREGSHSPEGLPHSHSSQRHLSSPSSRIIKSDKPRMDLNQNVNVSSPSSDEEENLSAFRKVEKHSAPTTPHHPSLLPATQPDQPQPFDLTATSPSTVPGGRTLGYRGPQPKVIPRSMDSSAMIARYPLMPPGAFPPAILASSGLSENIPMNLADLYKNPIKLASMGRSIDKLGDINNIENNNMVGKLPAYFGAESRAMGVPMPFGYYKSPNPMVDKILSTNTPAPATALPSLATLASNWCAKCNATFRMTSDLVYHMRSHHKSNTDPMRKKREDKLKCNICGETFRERHHLTRHMTSHA